AWPSRSVLARALRSQLPARSRRGRRCARHPPFPATGQKRTDSATGTESHAWRGFAMRRGIFRNKRGLKAFAARLVFGGPAFASPSAARAAKSAPAARGPQAAIDKIWGKLLTHCGPSYFYAGSIFDKDGFAIALARKPFLIEFQTVKFNN